VMYNVANEGTYNTDDLQAIYNTLTP